MSNVSVLYPDVDETEGWIDFLTTALPFSFGQISKRDGMYVLGEPLLAAGPLAAKHINYWTRGSIFYTTGKLLDHYPIDRYWQGHRMETALSLRFQQTTALLTFDPVVFFNSMQLEKMWQRAQDNHLDRERAIMTHVIHGVELCLKALATHASYRANGVFQFPAGHDIAKLYNALPYSLQEELIAASETFVESYAAYTHELEEKIEEVREICKQNPPTVSGITQFKVRLEWLAEWVDRNSYTMLLGSNDPGSSVKYLHSGWLTEAINQLKEIAGMGDVSSYFRYSSEKKYDDFHPM